MTAILYIPATFWNAGGLVDEEQDEMWDGMSRRHGSISAVIYAIQYVWWQVGVHLKMELFVQAPVQYLWF